MFAYTVEVQGEVISRHHSLLRALVNARKEERVRNANSGIDWYLPIVVRPVDRPEIAWVIT